MIPSWAGRYVGAPFKIDGASLDGLDCWGLCHLVLKEQAHIDTPTYIEETTSKIDGTSRLLGVSKIVSHAVDGNVWTEVKEPKIFDCLLMAALTGDERARRVPSHVGMMLSAKHVLHVWKETDSVIIPITHPMVRSKIIAFYRHKDLL